MENYCSMRHYEITQSQHCSNDNDYNDDNMMRVSVCGLNSLVDYFEVRNPVIYGKEM